ncbi:MAG: hypothetical protein ACREDR_19070, partial [Blastocatellia bacterium]
GGGIAALAGFAVDADVRGLIDFEAHKFQAFLDWLHEYFPLYVNILSSPFDQGLAGVTLLGTHCRGKTYFSTRFDRSREIVLPLAAFLGQSTIGGTCFEHPLYKDPTSPGVALEKDP